MNSVLAQLRIAREHICPSFYAFGYDADESPFNEARAKVLCVEIGWLGLFVSMSFELSRPSRRK